MTPSRTRWLALLGGVALIALSLSTALAGKPDAGGNRGDQVSAFVHSLLGGAEASTDESQTPDASESADASEAADPSQSEDATQSQDASAPSDHGACVAAVAQSTDVGGANQNHGGAVSEAARVTCWGDSASASETNLSTSGPVHGKGHGKHHGGSR
jgi:hypothetical protein